MGVLEPPLAVPPARGEVAASAPEVGLPGRLSILEVAVASTIVSVQIAWLSLLAYTLWRLIL